MSPDRTVGKEGETQERVENVVGTAGEKEEFEAERDSVAPAANRSRRRPARRSSCVEYTGHYIGTLLGTVNKERFGNQCCP